MVGCRSVGCVCMGIVRRGEGVVREKCDKSEEGVKVDVLNVSHVLRR